MMVSDEVEEIACFRDLADLCCRTSFQGLVTLRFRRQKDEDDRPWMITADLSLLATLRTLQNLTLPFTEFDHYSDLSAPTDGGDTLSWIGSLVNLVRLEGAPPLTLDAALALRACTKLQVLHCAVLHGQGWEDRGRSKREGALSIVDLSFDSDVQVEDLHGLFCTLAMPGLFRLSGLRYLLTENEVGCVCLSDMLRGIRASSPKLMSLDLDVIYN